MIVGLGISTYSGASGVALAQISDIMGDHRITLIGDVQIDFTDYAQVFGVYEYLKLRADLMIGGFYYKYYSLDGTMRNHVHHVLETGGFVGASYPFSMFSRVDAQVLGRHVLREPVPVRDVDGVLQNADSPTLKSNALIGTVGYSFDNILWGITGPLRGFRGRARLHLSPPLSFTDVSYFSADVDLRHYLHPFRRFVWANRVTAAASFGLDGEESARRFFLGGNENWFNYWVHGGNYDDNIEFSYYSDLIAPLRGWNYFDFVGDRALLMNSEWRFPFIREITAVWPLPLQIRYIGGALFVDGGYAWDSSNNGDDDNNHAFIPPRLAGGYGFGMRANLGIFVLRYDRGWPIGQGRRGPINYFSLGAEF